MAGPNLLIGNGQVLAAPTAREVSGSSSKDFPYTIERARERLGPSIDLLAQIIDDLPKAAKPRGEGTGLVMVHPAYLVKTRMPSSVFKRAGLRTVGSRGARVVPERDHRERAPTGEQPTAEVYVAGTSEAFRELARMLRAPDTGKAVQEEFCKLEMVRVLDAPARMIHLEGGGTQLQLEVVLHCDAVDQALLDAFEDYARTCGVFPA
jgi:hypothetical protein